MGVIMSLATSIAKTIARAALKSLAFKYDWSFNRTYNFIRDVYGVAYRRADMLADFRRFKGRVKNEYGFEHLRDDWTIPKRLIVETDLGRPYNYRIFAKVTYYNNITGQYITKMASFYTDNRKSKQEYIDDFETMWYEKHEEYEWEISETKIVAMEHNQGMGY